MPMTEEHRKALKRGREEARAIKAYLAAISQKKRGRPVTAESLTTRIKKLEEQVDAEPDALKRIDLLQKRIDLERRLADIADAPDVEALEKGFVTHAKRYSERKGISYAAWREGGVPAAVLKQAGISRAAG